MHSSQKVVVLLTALLLAPPAWPGAKNHYECGSGSCRTRDTEERERGVHHLGDLLQ